MNLPNSSSHELTPDQARALLASIKTLRKISRQRSRPPGRGKLAPYYHYIRALHQIGASERDIQAWLRWACRCEVSKTTIHHTLKALKHHEL